MSLENRNLGDAGWRITHRSDTAQLAFWASPYDASHGDLESIRIRSSFPGLLKVEVYRIGWYNGLGGRLMTSHFLSNPAGFVQPACTPPFPGPVSCPWAVTDTFRIGEAWLGGLYLIRIASPDGQAASYPFVVRSRTPHSFAAVIPQFTWQAYNTFGGSSLYTKDLNTGYSVPKVSFERPYATAVPSDSVSGSPVIPIVQWLERQGVDLSYVSDLDLADSVPLAASPLRGFLFLGHDEYWTWDQYSAVLQYKAAGRHLAFFGANNAWWNVRLSAGTATGLADGVITCYKRGTADPEATTPQSITTTFQSSPLLRPENALYGIIYRSLTPDGVAAGYAVAPDSMMGPEARAFLADAGLLPGHPLGVTLAREGDGILRNNANTRYTPPNLQVLFESLVPVAGGSVHENEVTFFIAPSGAGVFASGNNLWPAFLDPIGAGGNTAAQSVTNAVLKWMAAH